MSTFAQPNALDATESKNQHIALQERYTQLQSDTSSKRFVTIFRNQVT